ncbi:MAG TPA: hypothetical protein VGP94_02195 [Tepidisphaeraceae bacterium]|jgi:hypothetical protein|nr:hypothetical protein [Tepidisphaeraceae bacterium]
MWETLENRQMMSVTLGSETTLPYIEQTPISVDGGGTTVEAQRTITTISDVQKQLSDTRNAVISKMA